MSPKSDFRNGLSNAPLTYDRPAARRRSQSPGQPSRYLAYGGYTPEPAEAPFRDGCSDSREPSSWRPFCNRTSPPERYGHQESSLADRWDHPVNWNAPESLGWPDRREIRTYYDSSYSGMRRETMAERMFEPSDSWKQSHNEFTDGPGRERPHESFPVLPGRTFPPQRPMLDHYSPPHLDHSPSHNYYSPLREHYPPQFSRAGYRPPSQPPIRHPCMNPGSDSYRPLYDDDRDHWKPYVEEPYSDRFDSHFPEERFTPHAVWDRSPLDDRKSRHFRSRERSLSAGSSRVTGLYSPTTARVHSPEPTVSGNSPTASSPSGIQSVGASSSSNPKTAPRFRSSSRAIADHMDNAIIVKQEEDPVLRSENSDSIASTPHEEYGPPRPPVKFTAAALEDAVNKSQPSKLAVISDGSSFKVKESVQHDNNVAQATSVDLDRNTVHGRDAVVVSHAAKSSAASSHEDVHRAAHSPTLSGATEASVWNQTLSNGRPLLTQIEPAAEDSDMEMSMPPSPVEGSSVDGTAKLHEPRQLDALHEQVTDRLLSQPSIASNDRKSPADESDMDMSPPPPSARRSPPLKKMEDTGHVDRHIADKMQPVAPVPGTPLLPATELTKSSGSPSLRDTLGQVENPTADIGSPGDVSDMDMSPPGSPYSSGAVHRPSVSVEPATEPNDLSEVVNTHPPDSTSDILEPLPNVTFIHEASQLIELETAPASTSSLTTPPQIQSEHRDQDIPVFEDSDLMPLDSSSGVEVTKSGAVEQDGMSLAFAPTIPAPEQQQELHGVVRKKVVSRLAEATEADEQANVASDAETLEANPLAEGLRAIVMARLRNDRQTKGERIYPILVSNLAITEVVPPRLSSSPDTVIQELLEGDRMHARENTYLKAKPSLRILFAQRQAAMTEKLKNLREEYLVLHERWMVHCAKLDEVAEAAALLEAAATAGRTTRRSAALGDAVRTDLEMEQIIASLGNEELTDANHLGARNAATIPDMISVTKGSVDYLFDDTNNVVEDPASFYAPSTGFDDWTEEEMAVFLEKYTLYPKQFGIIADFLPYKTAAQCVTYYYLHKNKIIDFRKVLSEHAASKRKRGGGKRAAKKKGNALLTDIREHDAEVSRDSAPSSSTKRRKRSTKTSDAEPRRAATSRRSTTQPENSPITTPTPGPEPEPRRRRRASKPSVRAVAAMEHVEEELPEPEPRPAKRGRKSRKIKAAETVVPPLMSEEMPVLFNETRFIDQTELTSRKKVPPGSVHWSEEDKELFLSLLAQHGDDFKRIAASMPNKTTIQVSTFYKANLVELNLANVAAGAPKRSPSPDTPADIWKESTFPGSGMIAPNAAASTPPPGIPTSVSALGSQRLESAAEKEEKLASASTASMASSSSGVHFRATSIDAMRAQYGANSDISPHVFPPLQSQPSPFASMVSPHPLLNSAMMGSNIRPASVNGAPATLTMTFPSSFAYSNLSPSHFTGEQRPPTRATLMRGVTPPSAPSSSTMTFDSSMFAQQSWTYPTPATGQSSSLPPGVPAALQTTEDLVAYLEHRTRMGGERPSDFFM